MTTCSTERGVPTGAKLFSVVLCAVVLVCGCRLFSDISDAQRKVAWTGALADVHPVWSAEPGLDLLTQPAVSIRAYLESFAAISAMADMDYGYPGFLQAVPPTANESRGTIGNLRPVLLPSSQPESLVGTEMFHLLRVDATEGEMRAFVCDFSPVTAGTDHGDGSYGRADYWRSQFDTGVHMHWVAMRPPDPPRHALPPQAGSALTPSIDVFNGWHVFGHITMRTPIEESPTLRPELAMAPPYFQACLDKAPYDKGRRWSLLRTLQQRSDFPTLPAYPGWPG